MLKQFRKIVESVKPDIISFYQDTEAVAKFFVFDVSQGYSLSQGVYQLLRAELETDIKKRMLH
jgi:hypothetical protein